MPKIFFSYAWGDTSEKGESREAIVNNLYNVLKKDGYQVVLDKVDLGYKGLITDFMQRIGKADKVIVVISDKYVRSPYCMFELYEIARNCRFEKSDFKEKVNPVLVEFIDFTKPEIITEYLNFWQKEQEKWEQLFQDYIGRLAPQQFDQYNKVRLIGQKIGELMDWILEMNTLNPILLSESNFAIIKKAIGDLLKTNTDWENLIREIKEGNCVIFLGHGLITDSDGNFSYSRFCDQLATKNKNLINAYYPEENFFLFKNLKYRRNFTSEIDSFYKNHEVDSQLYEMLAEIPVPLYISISPDKFLKIAIGENGDFDYYNNKKKSDIQPKATKERPLLYQTFGSIEDTSSLILSHDNLYDFLKSVLGDKELPLGVEKFFKDGAGGEIIFLGFDFRKWYVQLLLRIFNLNKTSNDLYRTAYTDLQPVEEEKLLAFNHFQIQFIDTYIKEFVSTLHQKCKEKGILRKLDIKKEEDLSLPDEANKKLYEDVMEQLKNAYNDRNECEGKLLKSKDIDELNIYENRINSLNELIVKLEVERKLLL